MYALFFKRVLDIFFSLALLAGLSWLFLFLILVYWVGPGRPVFFVQARSGKNGKPFRIIKFRTLAADNSTGYRRFWLGDILRAFSLDELPQLINVIAGEMSLIGPRPLPVEYLPLMTGSQSKRLAVQPGITGWTQVNGRHTLSWEKKFELDKYYIEHLSFWLDVKIVFLTFFVLVSFKKDISLEEKPFVGS